MVKNSTRIRTLKSYKLYQAMLNNQSIAIKRRKQLTKRCHDVTEKVSG
jgi:hypothetical protein